MRSKTIQSSIVRVASIASKCYGQYPKQSHRLFTSEQQYREQIRNFNFKDPMIMSGRWGAHFSVPFCQSLVSGYSKFNFSSQSSQSGDTNSSESKTETQPDKETEDESKESEIESLLAALAEKEVEIEEKKSEIEKLKDGVLRSYAEMENLRDRTRREVDSTRKFSVQGFAKDLLDVGDNLARAVSVVPQAFREGTTPEGSPVSDEDARKLLKSLVEGVLMTEQQLLKVFKRHGLERFDPTGEDFDPNFHNALFEVSDPQKTPGTVAIVTKVGYKLHDRVVRPAEVGVVKAVE